MIVAHSSALNWEDGALTPRLHKALAEIYPAAEVLIVISPAGEVDVPQAVWSVVLDEDAVQPRLDTDALSVTAATAAQGVERILEDLQAKPEEALVLLTSQEMRISLTGCRWWLWKLPLLRWSRAPKRSHILRRKPECPKCLKSWRGWRRNSAGFASALHPARGAFFSGG